MQSLRRQKLRDLLANQFKGRREDFLEKTGYTKGRLSQLLNDDEPFGEVAARNIEERLLLEPGYFDKLDARTVAFATQFEALPPHIKDKWEALAAMLARTEPG